MINKNAAIKAGAGYTLGNILIKGIAFISLPIFSRILSTDEFGYYNTYIAYEAIVSIIMGLGMHASIKNAKYDFPGSLNSFISTQTISVSIMATIIFLITICFRETISYYTGFSVAIIVCLILQSYGTSMLNILNVQLSLDYNYRKYLLYAGINTILNILLSIVLIFSLFNSNRLLGRVVGSAIPLFIIGITIFFSEYMKVKENHFRKEMFFYAASFGFPLIWHYLSQQIAAQFDRIMIMRMVGATYTGIYSFVYSIANIFTVLFYSTDNVWNVWLFKEMNNGNYENIRERAFEYILLMSGIVCVMMCGSKEVIWLMGTEEYLSGSVLFMPIIIGMFFLFLYTIPVGIEYYFKETKYIGITTLLTAVLNIILNYFFIGMYGYIAAAYTTAVSYLMMFISHWVISKKILEKHNIKPFFKIYQFIGVSALVIILGIITVILNNYIWVKYIFLILIIISLLFKYKKKVKMLIKKFLA